MCNHHILMEEASLAILISEVADEHNDVDGAAAPRWTRSNHIIIPGHNWNGFYPTKGIDA